MKLMISISFFATVILHATGMGQSQGLWLDTTFRITAMPSVNQQSPNVSWLQTAIPRPDGKLIVSGRLHYYNFPYHYPVWTVRLNPDGSRDMSFPSLPGPRSRIWQDQIYVGPYTPRRYSLEGVLDPTFSVTVPNGLTLSQPSFRTFDVLNDGSLIMGCSGGTIINGVYTLMPMFKLDNTGVYDVDFLDTLNQYSPNGSIFNLVRTVSNDQFIVGGGGYTYQGQTWNTVVRFSNDGHLDTTFTFGLAGKAYDVLELYDGKYMVCGRFTVPWHHDTICVARLETNGALDTTFHYWTKYTRAPGMGGGFVSVYGITSFEDKFIVTGNFHQVDGASRGSIALIDQEGFLVPNGVGEPGTSGTQLQNNLQSRSMHGSVVTADGIYAFGGFHGYADAYAADPTQVAMVRLLPQDIILAAGPTVSPAPYLVPYPNPTHDQFQLASSSILAYPITVVIHDNLGRCVIRTAMTDAYSTADVTSLTPGVYSVSIISMDGVQARSLLVVE